MASGSLLETLFQHWLLVLAITFTAYILSNKYNRGLNKYPGPFLASITDWWRFWIVYKRRPELEHIKLHEKYGEVVRLGPNCLSFSDPKALKTIYGLNKGFVKVSLPNQLQIRECGFDKCEKVGILPSPTISSRRPSTPLPLQHNIRILPRPTPSLRKQRLLNVHSDPV